MKIIDLSKENTILNSFIAQMRSIEIQKDPMRFRRNLERVGEIMAYEISKTLRYKSKTVETPLGEAEVNIIDDEVVLATILRAGIPMHNGFLNYFDSSQCAFISAYRHYKKDGKFDIQIDSITTPSIAGKTVIMIDPMLATGASIEIAIKGMTQSGGEPEKIHIASMISSEEGLEYVKKNLSGYDVTVWTGTVDAELTVKSYIVPGIGDAGDLAYGDKL